MIFLSYRRSDEPGYVARLSDALCQEFGRDAVFRDVDKLIPGKQWQASLDAELEKSSIVLAVIGKHWVQQLADKNVHGDSTETDYVRYELNQARSLGLSVIPVLLHSTTLPSKTALGNLDWLLDVQAVSVQDGRDRWEQSIHSLVGDISTLTKLPRIKSRAFYSEPLFVAATVILMLVLGVFLFFGVHHRDVPEALKNTHSNVLPIPLGELAHNWEDARGLALFLDAPADAEKERQLNSLLFPASSGDQAVLIEEFCDSQAACIACKISPTGVEIEDATLVTVSLMSASRLIEVEMLTADRQNSWPIQDDYLPWEYIDRNTGERSLFTCDEER